MKKKRPQKLTENHIPTMKKEVWLRDGYICWYCGLDMSLEYAQWKSGKLRRKKTRFTVDHIVPKSRGGVFSFKNLVTSCRDCNTKKDSIRYDLWMAKIGKIKLMSIHTWPTLIPTTMEENYILKEFLKPPVIQYPPSACG